jgi:cation transport ATPase
MTDKPQTPFVEFSRMEGFIIGGVAIVAAILVGIFVGEDRGWVAGCAAGALAAVIRISWPLRKEHWFWAAMAGFTVANAFGVEFFDWSFTHSWSGHSVSGLMVIDIAVMVAIIYGLYCLIYGAPSKAVADLVDEPTYSQRDVDL